MNRRDLEDYFLRQDLLRGSSTQRLIEEAERRALREDRLGLHRLVQNAHSRISETERRLLNDPRRDIERMYGFRDHETVGGLSRATEMALAHARQVEGEANRYRTGAALYDYFERGARAEREALAAFRGHEQVERMLGAANAGWERTLRSEQLLARAGVYDFARDAATAYYASVDTVARRLAESEALNARATRYAAGLIEPTSYHARYSQETLGRLTGADLDAGEAAALRGSLTLFNDQIVRLTAAVTPLIVPSDVAPRVLPARVEFNLPTVQQKELIERQEEVPEDADYEELVPLAPSSRLADEAIACVTLYERCNESRMLRSEEPFFKPTTRGTVAACRMAVLVADDRDKFDFFIDQLYMLIYEGAGGRRQKYLVENGGVMERPECEVVWDIKQLRSKRSRHDIEHGSEGEVRKKYRDLGEMYRRLGLSRLPQTPEEYGILQLAVLRNLRAFLTELAERIENGGYPGPSE